MQQAIPVAPDVASLDKFFRSFSQSLITFSVQPEKGVEGAQLVPGQFFSPQNRVRAVPLETAVSIRFQQELATLQRTGCAIYFTMNEGNGAPSDEAAGNLNCGRRENIVTLSTLAIDTDTADAKALMAELTKLRLMPHWIVETRPGRYHFYFLIKPTKAEGQHILRWKAVQRKLASLVPALDQSLADINQVLRVPGFFNLKEGKRQQVKIYRHSEHELFDLEQLYHRLEAYKFDEFIAGATNVAGATSNGYHKFEFPTGYLKEGERRQAITRYMERVMENVLPLECNDAEFWFQIDGFINKFVHPRERHEFLEGGSRRANLEQYYHDQRNYRLKKRAQEQAAVVLERFKETVAVEDNYLPDDFYTNFPGDLGVITNEIHRFDPKLSLELCFAGALAISGALKAERFRFKGVWPLVNGLVVAGSGAGKSTLIHCIRQALLTAGLAGKYGHLVDTQNTVQSLHMNLYAAGGVGTMLVDEGGDYLESLNAKNAPTYAKLLRKYIKEGTTGTEQGAYLSPGGSMSFKVPPINGGMLSVWIFMQPDKFQGSLSLDDMADGFMPRFFVFNAKSIIDLTSFGKGPGRGSFRPSMDMEVLMQGLVSMSAHRTYGGIEQVLSDTEAQVLAANRRAKRDAIAAAQMDAVYRVRSEERSLSRLQVKITPEAEALVTAYLAEQEEAARKLAPSDDTEHPALVIYIRIAEMLHRLLANAVHYPGAHQSPLITEDLARQVIKFHRFQAARFFGKELEQMSQGADKDAERVYQALIKAVRKNEGHPVPAKDIRQVLAARYRPRNFSAILKELVNRGEVMVSERAHQLNSNRKVTLYAPDTEDKQIV